MTGIRSLTLVALVFLAACGNDPDVRPSDWQGPVAQARSKRHDFGPLFAGARETAVFMIENKGSADLEILRTHEDCGCTKPSFDRSLIPPGQSATMTVVFEAPAFHGTMRKKIRVETNDRWAGPLEFEVWMEGLGQASLSEAVFDFDGAEIGFEGLRRRIDLRLPEGYSLENLLVEPEAPFLRLERSPDGQAVDLVIDRPWHRLDLRDYIDFYLVTRDPSGKERRLKPQALQLSGRVKPKLACDPPIVDFGWLPMTESASRTLRFPGHLVPAEASGMDAGIDWRPGPEPGVFEVVVGPGEPGALRRLLRLRQDDGTILELPILAYRSGS